MEFDGGEKWMGPLWKEGRASISGRRSPVDQIFWPSSRFPGLFGSAWCSPSTAPKRAADSPRRE